VYKSNSYQELYDKTWTQGGYPSQSCWGCRFAVDVIEKLKFHTVLDAGTGNGALTRLMREHSKSAFGIELSRAVLEKVHTHTRPHPSPKLIERCKKRRLSKTEELKKRYMGPRENCDISFGSRLPCERLSFQRESPPLDPRRLSVGSSSTLS
jgi:hypothetical protein